MLAQIASATLLGVDGHPVTVEVHVSNGLPGFTIVGLPDAACRESRDRVRSALLSSGLTWPLRRVTVNLAPSTVRKGGSGLDLPIAVGVLVAAGEVAQPVIEGCAFLGELGLDGSVRAVPGTLALVDSMSALTVVVARQSHHEATLVGRHVVRAVASLRELVDALNGEAPWPNPPAQRRTISCARLPDLADVRGQRLGRWAVEVAAAGGHHLLMTGPPGSGKTMLARRLPGLLPDLPREQALECTRIHSAAGVPLPDGGLITRPPFRAPHHSSSAAALVGGGPVMRPGEISLAHRGALLLDEMAEFTAPVLDALREPLEEGVIRVARARAAATFPARFLLVGAMNPCPCGHGGLPGACSCSERARSRYARRLSGPLLDRFDLRLRIARPSVEELLAGEAGEPSDVVAARVQAARERAVARGVECNARLTGRVLEDAANLTPAATRVLEHKLRVHALTARGMERVLRVARTIADLADTGVVDEEHLCSALEMRADVTDLDGTA